MNATYRRATDGRWLVTVVWERETPDADAPTIEAVYEVVFSDDFTRDESRFLVPLSVTRMDTREVVELSTEEQRAVKQAAANCCATLEG